MSWILFSFLGPLTWAVTNIIDKYILSKWVRPLMAVMGLALVGGVLALAILFVRGFGHMSFFHLALALVCGAVFLLAELFYFKAAQIEEISRVVSLVYLDPLFTAVLSAFLLGEIFTPTKYLGVCLLVAGAIIISYRKAGGSYSNKAFWLCVGSAFMFACYNLLIKYLVDRIDFWTVFSYVRLGCLVAALPLCYLNFQDFKNLAKQQTRQFSLMIFNNVLILSGTLFFIIASSLGYVTLTSAISATQPFFVLVLVVICSAWYSKVLKEELNSKTIFQKLFAIVLIFIGALLVIRLTKGKPLV